MSTSSTKVSGNIAMDLLIHLTLFAYVGCCNTTKNVKSWKGRYHTPPTPTETRTPPNQRAVEQISRETWSTSKDARTSAETSATDHSRCSEVTMIWKEIRTRRGLRRPSETKQGQRAMISLSVTQLFARGISGLAGTSICENIYMYM